MLFQQVIDGRQRGTRAPFRLHASRGAIDLPIPAAFRVRLEREALDELSCFHDSSRAVRSGCSALRVVHSRQPVLARHLITRLTVPLFTPELPTRRSIETFSPRAGFR